MNRRHGVLFASLLFSDCSANVAVMPQSGGASNAGASNGSGGALSSAAGAGGSINAGAAGLMLAAQAGAAPAGAGTGGVNTPAGGGGGGASAGLAGSSGAAGGLSGSSGALGAAGGGGASGNSGASYNAGSAGSAGSGGAPTKYCDTHAISNAPVIVTDHFDDVYVGTASQVTEHALPSVCDDAAEANAVGSCAEWTYTPSTGSPSGVKLQWVSDAIGVKYAPTCMAPGMTRVTFAAKGAVGGEKLTFGASQATPIVVTLTTAWTQYSISLAGVAYNTDAVGVQPGFFWQTDPANGTIRFAVDDIKYVDN
ncbi:MAG TPA: hypothetical protein VFK05_02195 [Polyangiaceae bacterium]|nr:hypothetical protein [Polyangiaceae bacterium]